MPGPLLYGILLLKRKTVVTIMLMVAAFSAHGQSHNAPDLAYLAAQPESDGIEIAWITVQEKNSHLFTVEKSRGGAEFDELITLKGAGTTTNLSSYTIIDKNPLEGLQYFRLKQTNTQGQETYSRIIAVFWSATYAFHVFPNPTTGELFANLDPKLVGKTGKLLINHTNGKVIVSRSFRVDKTTRGVKLLKNSEILKPGKYLVSLNFSDQSYSQMIVSR